MGKAGVGGGPTVNPQAAWSFAMNSVRPARLLGFAPSAGLAALQAELSSVPGPQVWTESGETVAAVLQTEPKAPLIRRGRKALLEGLQTVQRRLEIACQAGPFLPMDPAAATCPADTARILLQSSWPAVAPLLARHGSTRQWDVVLRWSPEPVVAAHRADLAEATAAGRAALAEAVGRVLRADRAEREAVLIASLTPAVLAIAPPAGSETEVALTVLISAEGEAAMEAALGSLSGPTAAHATLDLRGPLPPVSFFAARLAAVEQGDVASAWRRLGLAQRIDAAGLHRQWRERAAAAHPDRRQGTLTLADGTGVDDTVADLTDAYHILRSLLPETASVTLPDLLRCAGYRLILPPDGITAPDVAPARAPEAVI
jgi:hypothetical protein